MFLRAGVGFASLTLTLVVVGCGPSRSDVSGKVTYKGKAIKSGQVMFIGADAQPYYSELDAEGKYEIKQVPVGEVRVIVSSPDPAKQALVDARRGERDKAAAVIGADTGDGKGGARVTKGTGKATKDWFPLPLEYSDLAKSPLKYTVTRGPNTHDIKLE